LLGSSLQDNTVVLVDPKGEIADLAGAFFQTPFAANPSVFVIDPWDVCGTGASSRVNVLDRIRSDNPHYVDDARALADAMVIPSGAENTHWDNAARNFLTGVILYVALSPKEEAKRDLTRVRDIITLPWAMPAAYAGRSGTRCRKSYLPIWGAILRRARSGAPSPRFATVRTRNVPESSAVLSATRPGSIARR
jgi:hypothetical protein